MTEHRAQGNARVDGLALILDGVAPRLDFPHAELERLVGNVGGIEYGATDLVMEKLTGRLRGVAWGMDAASIGGVWLRDAKRGLEIRADRVELPHGLQLSHAAGGGIELVAPHASFSDVTVRIRDVMQLVPPRSSGGTATTAAPASTSPGPASLRQERLRFLDAMTGELGFRIAVVLDLPVIGHRTLDQSVKVEIDRGSFDFKKLDDGLTWLEGQFLAIGIEEGRFRIGWGLPLFGTKEIISWALDADADDEAARDRVPLRALADFRLPTKDPRDEAKPSRLRSLTLDDIRLKLSLVAPRTLDFARGSLRFGGDDAPGIVDLHVAGALVPSPTPGSIQARASAVDATLKDLHFGSTRVTADRLTLGPIDTIAIDFDGFMPGGVTAGLHRVTATNLSLVIGAPSPADSPPPRAT